MCEQVLIQPFFMQATAKFLSLSVLPVVDKYAGNPALEGLDISKCTTTADFFELVDPSTSDNRRKLSTLINWTISLTLENELTWNPEFRGIIISDEKELAKTTSRTALRTIVAKLSVDGVDVDGIPRLIAHCHARTYFNKEIPLLSVFESLCDNVQGNTPVDVYDPKKEFSCVLRSLSRDYVCAPFSKTKHIPKGVNRLVDLFYKYDRMSAEEVDTYMMYWESNDPERTLLPIAVCDHYSNHKAYTYLARDLRLIMSTRLWGFLKDKKDAISNNKLLRDAKSLCEEAFKKLRSEMSAKSELLTKLKMNLSGYFEFTLPIHADLSFIEAPERSRFHRTEKALIPVSVIYPEGYDSYKPTFKKFITGPYCQIAKMNFKFDFLAHKQGKEGAALADTVADHVVERQNVTHPNALVVWRYWSQKRLPNKRILEFELLRRGVSVQHIIDEGQRGNANKVGNLMKCMTNKYIDVSFERFEECIAPFDLVVGLDISRWRHQDFPAFPVGVSKKAGIEVFLPESPFGVGEQKEKRSNQEVADAIKSCFPYKITSPIKVLFLRDGIAYEDYSEVAKILGSDYRLSVIAVRKNIVSVSESDLPVGNYYSAYAPHDENRFLFGVNARQGKGSVLSSMHMATVVRNTESLTHKHLSTILHNLASINQTTEHEVCNLPMPIMLADRMAWDIRDITQDGILLSYVKKSYPSECEKAGSPALFVYSTVRSFIHKNPRGWSWCL